MQFFFFCFYFPPQENKSASCMMSGFLQYSDNPKTWQRVFAVINKTQPLVLSLYAAEQVRQKNFFFPYIQNDDLPFYTFFFFPLSTQDTKPLSCISLLGCITEDPPQELHGQSCFNLRQSKSCHKFACENADVKRAWLAALGAAATGSDDCASESSGEEFIIVQEQATHRLFPHRLWATFYF